MDAQERSRLGLARGWLAGADGSGITEMDGGGVRHGKARHGEPEAGGRRRTQLDVVGLRS